MEACPMPDDNVDRIGVVSRDLIWKFQIKFLVECGGEEEFDAATSYFQCAIKIAVLVTAIARLAAVWGCKIRNLSTPIHNTVS